LPGGSGADVRIATRLSPNRSQRPAGAEVDLIIVHGTAGTDAGDLSWIANPEAKVSYHWHIARDGSVTLLVPEEMQAWHAGASEWLGWRSLNRNSVGVAFSNLQDGKEFFTAEQYSSGGVILRQVMDRHQIPLELVLPHSLVSPGRRTDPGPLFNWGLLFSKLGV
jgi:N-acetylmuramoyl-L-alanine amidase